MKYHSVREAVANNEVELDYFCSKEQVADILVNTLSFENFEYLRK